MKNIRDKIIQDLVKKFQFNQNVIGVLLAGSSSNSLNLNPNSDIDFIVVLSGTGAGFEFYENKGLWVEIFYENELRIRKCLKDNDEIMINCFRDGRILIDNKKILHGLKKIAISLGIKYKLSNYNLYKLRYRFKVILLKVKKAYTEEDSEKLLFLCIYAFPYLLRGIYVVNSIIPPTLNSWYDEKRLLGLDGGELIINLFKMIKSYHKDIKIHKLYKSFITVNAFLETKMGGVLKNWRNERREQYQTFL